MFSATGAAVGAGVLGVTWSEPVGEGSDLSASDRLNYGLDIAWSDALDEAARLRKSGSDAVVIGENQRDRVERAADAWGASSIAFGRWEFAGPKLTQNQALLSKVYNVGWIAGVMANKMSIWDIGRDPGRVARGQATSDWYRLERQTIDLVRYPRYEQRRWDDGGWEY